MKNKTGLLGLLLFAVSGILFAGTDDVLAGKIESAGLDKSVEELVHYELLPLCTSSIFVSETEKQNAEGASLEEIKKIDEKWINAEEELPIHREKLNNAAAVELKRINRLHPEIIESFVMDNQGGIVGSSGLTSDYWQGDEAKWQNSFNGGKGGIDVGKAKFDRSANAVIQQISLPILDKNGKVIGAVTWGIDVEAVKRHHKGHEHGESGKADASKAQSIIGKLPAGLDRSVEELVHDELVPQSMNTIFVNETEKQNAEGVSLEEIKKIDEKWINAEEELPIHREKLNNAAAVELKRINRLHPEIIESFVMDNQGGIVGSSGLTSDYWQGDEAKWQNSFNGGKGGIDVGKAKFDRSANAVIQQISLPIIDKNGKVIGAVTWGIDVEAVKRHHRGN